jgi:hypothetical protein
MNRVSCTGSTVAGRGFAGTVVPGTETRCQGDVFMLVRPGTSASRRQAHGRALPFGDGPQVKGPQEIFPPARSDPAA